MKKVYGTKIIDVNIFLFFFTIFEGLNRNPSVIDENIKHSFLLRLVTTSVSTLHHFPLYDFPSEPGVRFIFDTPGRISQEREHAIDHRVSSLNGFPKCQGNNLPGFWVCLQSCQDTVRVSTCISSMVMLITACRSHPLAQLVFRLLSLLN